MEDTSPSNHSDLSRRTVLKGGIATVGAVGLAAAASSALATPAVAEDAAADTTANTTDVRAATPNTADAPGNRVASATNQGGWRWCLKCEGLWYWARQTGGVCPAGGNHSSYGSMDYVL